MRKFLSSPKTIAIILLSAALIFCLFFILKMHFGGGSPFREAIDDKDATESVAKFRDNIFANKKSLGVWYDAADIKFYIDSIFPQLTTEQTKLIQEYQRTHPNDPRKIDLNDFKWQVGFYWMMPKDRRDGKTKKDFCVVPTLIKKDTTMACDYFDLVNFPFYNHEMKFEVRRRTPGAGLAIQTVADAKGMAFNTGTLFP